MKCLNCKKDLVALGMKMKDGTFAISTKDKLITKWTVSGEEYIECKHCKAKNFIEVNGPHTFTVGRFTID